MINFRSMARRRPRQAYAWLAVLFLAALASTRAHASTVLTVPLTYHEITNKLFVDDLLFEKRIEHHSGKASIFHAFEVIRLFRKGRG